MKKHILPVFIFFAFIFSMVLPTMAQAQETGRQWWNPDFKTFSDKVNGTDEQGNKIPANEIFGERYTYAQVHWIINSLGMVQMGDIVQCYSVANEAERGACIDQATTTGAMSSPLFFFAKLNDSVLSVQPASGRQYLAQKINEYSPIKSANAQTGFGYRTIAPLQTLWVAFRNVAFGLMAFAIIILAFMIMLRQKISPQVVVSLQSALPKVAMALIFITFSYAIAGLLIDLAYVVMGFAAAVISSSGLIDGSPNIIGMFNKMNNPIQAFTGWATILSSSVLIAGGLLTFFTGGLGAAFAAPAGIIAVILLALGLVAIFRIFVTMLRAFATLVFLIIGAPLIGVLSVVSMGPGIGGWVKNIAAQLSVFVVICMAMLLSHMIFWTMAPIGDNTFLDSLTAGANYYNFKVGNVQGGSIQFPGFGGFPVEFLGLFVGFGILFSAPKIATGTRDQILTGKASQGFDTWGTMAGPIAGLTAAGMAKTRSFGTGLAGTAIEQSVPAAKVRRFASNVGRNLLGYVPPETPGGSTTNATQNAANTVKSSQIRDER